MLVSSTSSHYPLKYYWKIRRRGTADYIALGKNVKKFRLMRNMRQKDLAELCDSSDSYIGHIENARGIPSLEMVVKIANALEVTVDQLLSDSYKNPEVIYLREIAERIEKYPVSQRIQACESLKDFLESLEKFGKK